MDEINVFSLMPVEVWQDERLTFCHVRVLGALLSFRAKNTDVVWPGRAAIAERCRMHVSNVSKATKELVEFGWLEKEGLGGYSKSTRYRVIVPALEKTQPETQTTLVDSTTVAESTTVVDSATRVVADSTTRKEETKEETKDTRARKAQKPKSPFILPPWLDPDVWQQFVDHRQAIKSKLTDQSARLAIRKLDTLRRGGSPPGAVIEQTVLNGWTGLFPIRPQFATGRTGALSESDLLRIGNELGLDPKPGESTRDYAARIDQAQQQFANQAALPHPPAANRTFP